MRRKIRKDLAPKIIILLTVLVLLAVGIGTLIYSASNQPAPAGSACVTEDGIRICLSADTANVKSSDEVTIKTTITNMTLWFVTEQFSCAYTGPTAIINGKEERVLCGPSITNRTIAPFGEEVFSAKISGSQLKEGQNELRTSWARRESGTVLVAKDALATAELTAQLAACQAIKEALAKDTPAYCTTFEIVINDSYRSEYEDCNKWKGLLDKLNLTLPCDDSMSQGYAYVIVPRESSDKYEKIIESLKAVKYAASFDDIS